MEFLPDIASDIEPERVDRYDKEREGRVVAGIVSKEHIETKIEIDDAGEDHTGEFECHECTVGGWEAGDETLELRVDAEES